VLAGDGSDAQECISSRTNRTGLTLAWRPPRAGIPRADQLQFLGNAVTPRVLPIVMPKARAELVEIDFEPFF
jgi:hypothetical protein